MENKENQLPQNQTNPQLGQKEPQTQDSISNAPKNKVSKALIYPLFALLFMVIGASGLWLYQNQFSKKAYPLNEPPINKKVYNSPNPSPKIDSEIVNIGNNTKKYINNEYGFTITFPSYNKSATTCEQKQLGQTGEMPLKIFEALDENTLFISNESILTVKHKQLPSGGYQQDYSTCKNVQNNISLIASGYDSGMPDPNNLGINIANINALQVNYKKISNENDLEALAQTLYKGCYIGEKNPLQNREEIYQVKLADEYGRNGYESGCITNFVYIFLYSPTNEVAVLTSGFQDIPFDGTNGQYEPQIEFPQ